MKWKLLDACPFFILACEKKERALFFSNKLGLLLELGPEWEHNYVTQTTQNQREGEKCKKHYNKKEKHHFPVQTKNGHSQDLSPLSGFVHSFLKSNAFLCFVLGLFGDRVESNSVQDVLKNQSLHWPQSPGLLSLKMVCLPSESFALFLALNWKSARPSFSLQVRL